jgi:transposase-like protein
MAHWQQFDTLFNYPDDIPKVIYITNGIGSNNSIIRKTVKRKGFPNDDSAKKMVYAAIMVASKD